MQFEIYYSKKLETYFYTGFMSCEFCHRIISDLIFLEKSYTKKLRTFRYFCSSCVLKRKNIPSIYNSLMTCQVIDAENLPIDALLVLDSPPVLSNFKGQETVFSMASKNIDGEKVIDRALQSRNPNFMIMEGVKTERKLLEEE